MKAFFVALLVALFLLIPVSWVVNAIKLFECDFDPNKDFRCEVVHVIGIIPVVSLATSWVDSDQP